MGDFVRGGNVMGLRLLVVGVVLGVTSVVVVDAASAASVASGRAEAASGRAEAAVPRGRVESTVLRAMVSNYVDDTLSLVDVTAGTVTGTISGIDGPAWLAASGDGQTMYVAAYNGDRLYKVNAATRGQDVRRRRHHAGHHRADARRVEGVRGELRQ
ncbi:hypothetical protein AB0J72_44215 [Dactylosporangium sp. NPDC049742]|uniref:YncE family protein n=1 Tax=Dactylosporangium sp. NPDC049742 TaxID=3154737 RepID=UPI003429BFEB